MVLKVWFIVTWPHASGSQLKHTITAEGCGKGKRFTPWQLGNAHGEQGCVQGQVVPLQGTPRHFLPSVSWFLKVPQPPESTLSWQWSLQHSAFGESQLILSAFHTLHSLNNFPRSAAEGVWASSSTLLAKNRSLQGFWLLPRPLPFTKGVCGSR